jgi:hypothetical protein
VGRLKTMQVYIGNQPYRMLFDNGGGETFISPDCTHAAALTPFGKGYGYRMNGEQISFRKYADLIIRAG